MSDIIQEAKHLPLAYELPNRVVEVIESLAAQLAAARINEASLVQDCIDAAWRETDLRAQLAAAQSRLAEIEAQEPQPANLLPTILFDGYTVYKEADEVIGGLIPEHVSAVLDVVVRHARNECARPVPPAAQTVAPACHATDTECATCKNDFRKCVAPASQQPAAQGLDKRCLCCCRKHGGNGFTQGCVKCEQERAAQQEPRHD